MGEGRSGRRIWRWASKNSNISPGEAGGERHCRGRNSPSKRPEAGGESEARQLGVLQAPGPGPGKQEVVRRPELEQ